MMNRIRCVLWQLVVLALLATVLAGCSGLSSLHAYNGYDKSIKLVIQFREGYQDSKLEEHQLVLDKGETDEVTNWFSLPPSTLIVSAYDGEKLLQTVDFREQDYPPIMHKGSSLGYAYRLRVTPAGMTLHDPSTFEVFERNGGVPIAGFILVCALSLAWLLLKANHSRQHKLIKPYKPD